MVGFLMHREESHMTATDYRAQFNLDGKVAVISGRMRACSAANSALLWRNTARAYAVLDIDRERAEG